jgi:hypothetical protein
MINNISRTNLQSNVSFGRFDTDIELKKARGVQIVNVNGENFESIKGCAPKVDISAKKLLKMLVSKIF